MVLRKVSHRRVWLNLAICYFAHPLTRAVLAAVGERSRSWSETVAEVVTRVPDWGRAAMRDERMVEQALAQYVWLLSLARRRHADRLVPLFAVEVQLWIREVSRVLRAVHVDPQFRWRDSAAPAKLDDTLPNSEHELPAVYCRRCGMSGWMAVASELGNTMLTKPNTIYQAALSRAATQRVLLRCSDHEPDAQHYDPSARQLLESAREATVPVLVTPSEDAAKRSQCPGCAEGDTIRFLGLQVASLASVSINTLFGSSNMESDERKLLAFTDSVQDASHRAAFFAGRTYRFNLRTLMAHAISDTAGISVAELGESLYLDAQTPEAWYGLVPPDLLRHPEVRTTWTDTPSTRAGRKCYASVWHSRSPWSSAFVPEWAAHSSCRPPPLQWWTFLRSMRSPTSLPKTLRPSSGGCPSSSRPVPTSTCADCSSDCVCAAESSTDFSTRTFSTAVDSGIFGAADPMDCNRSLRVRVVPFS